MNAFLNSLGARGGDGSTATPRRTDVARIVAMLIARHGETAVFEYVCRMPACRELATVGDDDRS